MTNAIARITLALAATAMLPACVGGLLGGGKPDRLFRFGGSAASTAAMSSPAAVPRRSVFTTPVRLPAAVAGDRILTVQGTQAAYVRDVRWVSPASFLFRDAVTASLRARVPDLAVDTTAGRAQAVLAIEITRFEATFADTDAVPVVHVEGVATLGDTAPDAPRTRLAIEATEPAANAGGAAMVAAFDAATGRVSVAVADWVNQTLPVPARPPAAPR